MMSLDDLIERAKRHFGEDINLEDIQISAEHIHSRCLGFDAYCYDDHDNFIVLTRKA
ncbi:hypothetical protein ACOI1H_14675 [Loktanella sp. DJP18]|uniref:hypothetical protein n=1 Tax=Loktanella sp. DJP18 TaxID=3409788 RepID=UPI003BB5A478